MRKLYTVAVWILAAAVLVGFFPNGEEAALYDGVLRLHVIAASDSEEDQAVKLAVRDALLETVTPLVADCGDRDGAAAVLADNADLLRDCAEQTLADHGFDYGAQVLLGQEQYPTRTYESAALPAGEYLSLRVVLGEGDGQNWWCVLFPPLCIGSAADTESVCVEAGLTPGQYRLITGGEGNVRYRVKFKLLEIFGEWFGKK